MPTLVLWGDADALIPVGQTAAWADLIPNAEVRTAQGAGHLIFDESREAVDALGEFVGAAVTS
jgi:pimeloyl-ACP methyl ester carboxylesterase